MTVGGVIRIFFDSSQSPRDIEINGKKQYDFFKYYQQFF